MHPLVEFGLPRKGRYPSSGKPCGPGGNGGFLDFLAAHKNQNNTANIETIAVGFALESSSLSLLALHHRDHMAETVFNMSAFVNVKKKMQELRIGN